MPRKQLDLGNVPNITMHVELNDGTPYTVPPADLATAITKRSASIIRGTEEIQLDPSLIEIDVNADSPVGEHNVSLAIADIQLLLDNTVQVLQGDDDLKLNIVVDTPNGPRTFVAVFDIFDPASVVGTTFELVAPRILRPFVGDPSILAPNISILSSRNANVSIVNAVIVRDETNNVLAIGNTPPAWEEAKAVLADELTEILGLNSMRNLAGFVSLTFNDGDTLTFSVRDDGNGTSKQFTVPIEAEVLAGPRVF